MKNMKKFFSLVLAIVMVMALAAPVMAAEDDYTITITNADEVNGVDHTYEAYQIFSGDFHACSVRNISVPISSHSSSSGYWAFSSASVSAV